MKKVGLWLAVAGLGFVYSASAVSLDGIQFWTGSGTNRAALVVEWSTPESFGSSTVPGPVADMSLVWGYRFNGTVAATEMLQAIAAADPRFYVIDNEQYGSTIVVGIGFSFYGTGTVGLADGSTTNYSTTNYVTSNTVDIDAAASLNTSLKASRPLSPLRPDAVSSKTRTAAT